MVEQAAPLKNGQIIRIGRQHDVCDIVVSDETVISRVHCVVSYDAATSTVVIHDKSTNGVYLENGRGLNGGSVTLKSDEIISLASGEVVFQVVIRRPK